MRQPLTTRRGLVVLALVLAAPALLVPGSAAGASSAPEYQRMNLLAADTDYLYWGVDPFDPELGVGSVSRTCGTNYVLPGAKPCLFGIDFNNNTRTFNLSFLPASLFEQDVTWDSSSPLRFHLEGAVNTFGFPYTVHFVVQKGSGTVESPPATEVAPGVWEGQIPLGSPLAHDGTNLVIVRVKSLAPAATIDLRLRGASYLELPAAVPARGVPDMIREDTYWPAPQSFATDTRSFTFNDSDWGVRSFDGTTGPDREFSFDLERRSEIVMAWVELFDSPVVQDVRRGRPPDPRKATQGAAVALLRGGEEIAHSGYGHTPIAGAGMEALAALDVAAGPLTVQVQSANDDGDSMPFTVHVLEIGGERTLRTMRWSFIHNESFRLPVLAACPGASEPVPATDQVRSIGLDLDWDTEAAGLPGWTIRFDMPDAGTYNCGQGGNGDRLRLTVPGERVAQVGATPAYDATFLSAYDTTFDMTASFVYSPPPAG